ncbi:MAG: DUF86 domain-containing protein, partial [Segatella copri]
MALCVRMLRRVWNEIKSWYMRELVREFNASHPEIPWKQVEGMRHVLVHGYSQVLPRILWATAKENIPEIKAQVE